MCACYLDHDQGSKYTSSVNISISYLISLGKSFTNINKTTSTEPYGTSEAIHRVSEKLPLIFTVIVILTIFKKILSFSFSLVNDFEVAYQMPY